MGAPPHPLREGAIAWMALHGAGYRKCAKHFDVPVGTARGWYEYARDSGDLGARPAISQGGAQDDEGFEPDEQAPDLSRLDGADLHAHLLRELGQTIHDAKHRGHGSVVAQCVRQVLSVRAAAEEEAQRNQSDEPLDREEYLAELELAVAGWPEDMFDVVFRVYEELRRVRVVKVVEGGRGVG